MIFSEAHNCVVYDHANPNLVVASIHGARRLNGHQVVVPADLFSLQLARQLGLPVPSLVDRSYDWPAHGIKPFEHQKITTAFLTMHPRCFVLSDMGTGKTLSTLWAADWLMKQGAVKKALIISPLSTLDATWRNEIFRHFLGRRKSVTVHGTRDQRLKALDANVDFYIINHDGVGIGSARRNGKLELGELGRRLRDRHDINLVIVDEVSAYKDSQTLRSRLLRQITDGKPYLWAMSGTPTPNAPTDAYGLMRLMNNHRGESFASFQERTMLRVSQFKWVPKPTATEIVHKALQPAIRYNRDDCIDLPDVTYETREVEFSDTQKKAYETLKKELSLVMKNGDRIDAVNEAVLRMKLIQISCIAAGTRVLTMRRGWVPIETVTTDEFVWDGKEFVQQKGAVRRGRKKVILTGSVWTTPDHRFLTGSGWRSAGELRRAKSSDRFDGIEVRLPYGCWSCRYDYAIDESGDVAVPMRMRENGCAGQPELAKQTQKERSALRLFPRRAPSDARHEQDSAVQDMDAHGASLSRSEFQGFSELRGAWNRRLQKVETVFPGVLGRHANRVPRHFDDRSGKQQRPVRTSQLPLGNAKRTTPQSTSAKRVVYDLVDCGPRQRFVVCGPAGDLHIVHNCGAVYGPEREVHRTDASPRISALEEVVEEAGGKILIFAPLTSVVNLLYAELKKKYGEKSVARIYGGTAQGQRNETFRAFQNDAEPRMIVADPGTMSHGLTLTAANTIAWFGPTDRLETYEQANARINRPGQKRKMLIVRFVGSPIEKEIFKRLENKASLQGTILKMMEG